MNTIRVTVHGRTVTRTSDPSTHRDAVTAILPTRHYEYTRTLGFGSIQAVDQARKDYARDLGAFSEFLSGGFDHAIEVTTPYQDCIRDHHALLRDAGRPSCDDPGAHRPECRCDGGEALL